MGIFDKVSSFAQSAMEKTTEMMETGKLSSRINGHNAKIGELKGQIGEYYWEKYSAGEPIDSQPTEYCVEIQAQLAAITEIEAEIQRIKDENAKPQPMPQPETPEGNKCQTCGTANPSGTKFCRDCGSKLEIPEPPAQNICACGTQIPAGFRFCPNCGSPSNAGGDGV